MYYHQQIFFGHTRALKCHAGNSVYPILSKKRLQIISPNNIKAVNSETTFGVEKNIDSSDTNAFHYCGEYYDAETGIIYLSARYYNPSIGRFISRDSYTGRIEDPLSLNLYTYCANNPIVYVDPSGHITVNSQWDWAYYVAKGEINYEYDGGSGTYAERAEKILTYSRASADEKISMKKGAPGCGNNGFHSDCCGDYLFPVPEGTLGEDLFNCNCSTHNGKHNGIDVRTGGRNLPIIASSNGVVEEVRYSESYGNLVLISYGEYLALYAHMQYPSSLKDGDEIEAGEQIGLTGNTGQSFGVHLHFGLAKDVPDNDYYELVSNKYWIDPMEWGGDDWWSYKE